MLGTVRQEIRFADLRSLMPFSIDLHGRSPRWACFSQTAPHRGTRSPSGNLPGLDCPFDALAPTAKSGKPPPIRTVYFGDELMAVANTGVLLQEGFYTSAVFFNPVACGQAGPRIYFTAAHSAERIRPHCGELDVIRDDIHKAHET